MKYALVNGKKTHVRDVARGTLGYDCWYDDFEVKACKGLFMQYWKYTTGKPNLPSGYENETEWHAAWKESIRDDCCEVIMGPNGEHRADIRTPERVIELQYSPIDIRDVLDRTSFYVNETNERIVWVINVYKARHDKRIVTIQDPADSSRFFIKWIRAKKWVVEICEKTNTNVFLDISPNATNLILLWKHQGQLYGKWVSKSHFYDMYLMDVGLGKEKFLSAIKSVDPKKFWR